jgi:hypothetical protein
VLECHESDQQLTDMGHLVVARTSGLAVGVAGRLAPPGVRRAGCFEASSAHNDRMRMGSGSALSAGDCTRSAGTRVVALAVLVLRGREW